MVFVTLTNGAGEMDGWRREGGRVCEREGQIDGGLLEILSWASTIALLLKTPYLC